MSKSSYYSNRTSWYDFKEMDEKYGLYPEESSSLLEARDCNILEKNQIKQNHLNCNLLKEITNSKFYHF
jgi:hypothetical protein